MMKDVQAIVVSFLDKHHIPKSSGFIIGVSGGADSITLLHVFKYMNLNILALHCNFGLRGKESDMDEQFVKRFCDSYGIALSVKKFDTKGYAAQHGISIEMAARDLRYEWFQEMKQKRRMDYITVGHHADDVAETIFINLCRGTGIKGLTGIKPMNGDVIRPLLPLSRADILEYIESHQLGFRTDSSNSSLDYVRNRIRLQVIPILKEINPAFLATTSENCRNLQETEAIFRYGIEQLKREVVVENEEETLIHIEKVMSSPAPSTLLYELLVPMGFNKSQIRDVLDSNDAIPGKQFLSDSFILTKGRMYWRIFKQGEGKEVNMSIPGDGEFSVNGKMYKFETLPYGDGFSIPKEPSIACLDADKLSFPLIIRGWKLGDRFCPLGMQRLQKKLSDFFIDRKFTTKEKQDCLLLVSGDKIAWVVGYRPDERFKVTPSTKRVLVVCKMNISAESKR